MMFHMICIDDVHIDSCEIKGHQRCQSSSRCPFLSKLPSLTRHLGNFQVNVSDGRLGLCGILIGHLDTLTNGNSARCGRCRCIKDCLKLLSYGSLRFLIPSFGIKKNIKFYPRVLLGPPAIPLFSLALIEFVDHVAGRIHDVHHVLRVKSTIFSWVKWVKGLWRTCFSFRMALPRVFTPVSGPGVGNKKLEPLGS